jgi:hypothetical protein
MTFADFLAQASFWQWFGLWLVAGVIAHGLGRIRWGGR